MGDMAAGADERMAAVARELLDLDARRAEAVERVRGARRLLDGPGAGGGGGAAEGPLGALGGFFGGLGAVLRAIERETGAKRPLPPPVLPLPPPASPQ